MTPHRTYPGNTPSSVLWLDDMTPHHLGALVALYEHKVFCQAAVWGICAFDQWGVELGKVLSSGVYQALTAGSSCTRFDASTNALINMVRDNG